MLLNATQESIDLSDLSGSWVITCCEETHTHYRHFEYLNSLNVNVAVICTSHSRVFHQQIKTFYPHWLTLHAHARRWIKQQADYSTDFLCAQFRCQILVRNGVEVARWTAPLEDQWKSFLSDPTAVNRFRRQFDRRGLEWLRGLRPESYSMKPWDTIPHDDSANYFHWVTFHTLIPNHELEKLILAQC